MVIAGSTRRQADHHTHFSPIYFCTNIVVVVLSYYPNYLVLLVWWMSFELGGAQYHEPRWPYFLDWGSQMLFHLGSVLLFGIVLLFGLGSQWWFGILFFVLGFTWSFRLLRRENKATQLFLVVAVSSYFHLD